MLILILIFIYFIVNMMMCTPIINYFKEVLMEKNPIRVKHILTLIFFPIAVVFTFIMVLIVGLFVVIQEKVQPFLDKKVRFK